MKDFNAEFEEWWEVVKEYFAKQLEKNLAQHKVNDGILMYKLEVHHKNFLEFVCGSPTNTQTLGQNEEAKRRPSVTTQEEEVQTEEPQELKGGGHEEREPQTTKE